MVVEYTRWTKRRRVCLKCGHQFWTVEMPMSDLNNLQGEDLEPSDD